MMRRDFLKAAGAAIVGAVGLSPPEAAAELMRRRGARKSLLEFTCYTKPDYRVWWHHEAMARKLDDVIAGRSRRVMFFYPPQHGKALRVDTPIPTPEGWTQIGDLRPGDMVFAGDGTVTPVVAVSPVWHERPTYTVTGDTSWAIVADAAHDWAVRLDRGRPLTTVRETQWLASRQETMRDFRAPLIHPHAGLDLPDVRLPVPPYTLGVWLGDGSATCGFFTQSPKDQPHLIGRIEAEGFTCRSHTDPKNIGVLGLKVILAGSGLLGNKHIPAAYMRAGRGQRIALLQGLVDTDGYVAPGGQVEFCTVRRELADGVHELLATLGVKASIVTGRATLYGRDCGPKYRVMFYFAEAASLPRKREKCRNAAKKSGHYVTVTPDDSADTVCIQVAHESHLFLAGRAMVPTHNSELVSRRFPPYAHGRNPDLRIINCSHTYDKAVEMNRDVQRVIDSPAYRCLFPEVRLSGRFIDASANGATRRTMDYFELIGHGGSLRSAGVGNSIAGSPADGIIIDDPFGKREDADSPTIREKVWKWYTNDVYTRLSTDAWIIITHTRWHRDDLAGRLLEKMADASGDKWEVINLPAIKTDRQSDPLDHRQTGEALWPDFKDAAALEIVRNQDLRAFAALYQQDPRADGATEWPEDWFKGIWFDDWPAPDAGQRVLALDSSKGKGGKTGDYSAFVRIQFYDDILWVDADLRNDRNADELAATMLDTQLSWKPHAASCEEEFGGPVLKSLVAEMAAARKVLVPNLFLIATGGVPKKVRIRRLTPHLAAKRIRFKSGSPGAQLLVRQLKEFPHGDHDDGPDALEMGIRLLVEGGVLAS